MFRRYILLFLLLVNELLAQSLSLDEAIQKAMQKHPDIAKFSLQVEQSRAGVSVVKADYLPQVNINAEYDPTKTYVFPSNGVFNTKDSDGWLVGATLHQKIWDFSKTTSSIDAKKEAISISKLSLLDAKALLSYKVKLQYELILVQRKAMKVREKDLEAKEALYKQANAFVETGLKTSADATRFLSSFYVAKDALAISKASFDKARKSLSLYIGEEIAPDVTLEDTLLVENEMGSNPEVLKNSPALKALEKGIRKSSLEYKSVKASHYGSIDAVASYTYQNTLNEYDSKLVGITLNVPLYSGGRTSALVEQAELSKQISEAGYSSKVLALQDEYEALLIDIKRYEQTIEAKEAQLKAATSTSNLLEARYKEGLATYIEVLDAAALKLDAELGLLSAKYEKSSNIHRLEYLQGKI